MAFSEIVPCYDPCVCVLGIFAVIFPTIQLLLSQHLPTSVCACFNVEFIIPVLKLVKVKEETSPRLTSGGTACGGSYAIFLLYLCIFLSTFYIPKQKSNNSIVVRLAIYGSFNRFFSGLHHHRKAGFV